MSTGDAIAYIASVGWLCFLLGMIVTLKMLGR